MKYSTILFDLDGTLTDPEQGICGSVRYALEKAGKPVGPIESYHKYIGPPLLRSFEVYANATPEEAKQLLGFYRERFSTVGLFENEVYSGIPELLHALAERGLKLAVLSNKPDADTKNVISHFFPDVPFSVVRGQVEGVPVKPDKAGALLVAEQLGIAPADFLYLGDTKVDMTCACSAGMNPVGVLWGFRTAQELLDNGAKVLIAHPMELLEKFNL